MSLTAVLRRMERSDITVHGFRSTFHDWAGETKAFPREVIEAARAHRLKDKAEAAYTRGDLFVKRRALMEAWASQAAANVRSYGVGDSGFVFAGAPFFAPGEGNSAKDGGSMGSKCYDLVEGQQSRQTTTLRGRQMQRYAPNLPRLPRLAAYLLGAILVATSVSPIGAWACTRFVYFGADGAPITARSMDWKTDVGTNLWVFPRGMERTGEAGNNSVKWTSKYGSVIASAYDIATTDGMNEEGLVANVLWLVESEYPAETSEQPGLTIAAWAQYVLDNFATVAEAVEALSAEPFVVVTDNVPGEARLATLHLSISDASGDSAIVEYIDGKQVIHHDRSYQVMTNSPTFAEQLALNDYWQKIGGTVFLPGTNRAADRFARASFYASAIPKFDDPNLAVAGVFSVIRNVSVPYGISTPDEPNISSTRWRTVSDHARKIYFFESALTPNTFWVDLNEIDFSLETGRVMKLRLGVNQTHTYAGNATSAFEQSTPFTFLGK